MDGDFDPGESDFADGMPDPRTGGLYSEDLAEAVESGEVPESRLDDMVARVLGAFADVGHFEDDDREGAIDTPEHRELAREIATSGTVLLENDGALPLSDDTDVALVGPNVDETVLGGGGSSETTPFVESTPVEGVEGRAGGEVTVARGIERVEDVSLFDQFGPDEGDEDADGPDVSIDDAVAAAADADVAVVFVRDQATEATDRETLRLPGDQDELVEAVAAAADETVVVLNTSGPVELPWREDVAAVLASWYPGQSHGDAAAAVLYGDDDPGGRLPVTFAPEDEYPATTEERFPGVDGDVHYDEGLLVGYRHFDATDAEATYPFGHGESYAEFVYGDVTAVDDAAGDVTVGDESEVAVEVEVENVGDRRGREVVQAYVDSPVAPDDLDRPPREFAGSATVEVGPGESATVTVALDERAFGRWTTEEGWTVDAGEHVVEVGRSSGDLRSSVTLDR
jgi:beta-glucosidase